VVRIAFFGPLPPSNTGIADYDQALLPLLRQHYSIDVFTSQNHSYFYSSHKQKPYDLNLYQMGNNHHFHEYMWAYAFQFPGAMVFHDYCVHHSRAGMLLGRNKFREYREELTAVYPEHAEKIWNAMITFAGGNLLFFYYPFFHLLLWSSLAAAAHTDAAVKQLKVSETPVIKIPHLELRSRSQIGADPFPERFVIASFGYATAAKRIDSVLQAMTHLRHYYPNILYLIVGEIEKRADIIARIEQLGLQNFVRITGHIDEPEFLRMMSRADVIVNLRYPSAGEMSGTLIRALACEKPVLVSDIPDLGELPQDAVVRIRPTAEVNDLIQSLAALIENRTLRERLSMNARKYIDDEHSEQKVIEKYRELIEAALARKSTFQRPTLPSHLRNSMDILRDYILRTSLGAKPSALVERVLASL
jgi:glycosyltransferase involved in cell wall biosynthesis